MEKKLNFRKTQDCKLHCYPVPTKNVPECKQNVKGREATLNSGKHCSQLHSFLERSYKETPKWSYSKKTYYFESLVYYTQKLHCVDNFSRIQIPTRKPNIKCTPRNA